MRPAPQRIEDLRRRLADAEADLAEAQARALAGAVDTAAAVAEVEEVARDLCDQLVNAWASIRNLEANVAETEELLGALKAGLATTLETRASTEAKAAVAGNELVALRARLDEEKSRFQPLVLARQREVEQLQRRITTKLAYATRAPLPALIPGKPAPTMSDRFAAARAAAEVQPLSGAAGQPDGESGTSSAPLTPVDLTAEVAHG